MTKVPAVADSGGVPPVARRIITPVKDASVGLVHDNAIDVLAGTAATSLTGGTVVGEAVTVMVLETGALAPVAPLATRVTVKIPAVG